MPTDVRISAPDLGNEHFLREHGRAPIDDRERGSFMATATRQQTTAVAGYDLTFAPVKSVSTLWALADRDVAKQIQAAHHAAVEATLSWLEKEVLFTRRGRGGLQQVRATGLIAGMFTHRDARSSDPHLHTHVPVAAAGLGLLMIRAATTHARRGEVSNVVVNAAPLAVVVAWGRFGPESPSAEP